MTVKELIKELKSMPKDLPVSVGMIVEVNQESGKQLSVKEGDLSSIENKFNRIRLFSNRPKFSIL